MGSLPSPEPLLPSTDHPTSSIMNEFDSLEFPPIDTDFLSDDFMADLGFDDNVLDFTLDDLDLYLPIQNEGFNVVATTTGGDDSLDGLNTSTVVSGLSQEVPVLDTSLDAGGDSVRVLNSTSPESGSYHHEESSQGSAGCGSGVSGFLNSHSPDSCGFSESGTVQVPDSPDNNGSHSQSVRAPEVVVVVPMVVSDQKVKLEEEGKECVSKRKIETNEDENSDNTNPRSSKLRKSGGSESVGPVVVEEDKKKARLMRNRESAQLSRQRKKHYVEELEDKVRAMHSTIADLNNKISFFMAENAGLRQQLGGGGGGGGVHVAPPPGMYPPPPMGHMPYPWIPCAGYPMRSQGSQVPLIPIPRLKTQQTASASKSKKSESKKKEVKTKKVASVSLLGLLFFLFLFGGLVPFVNVYKESRGMVPSGLGFSNDGLSGRHRGRVLTVNGPDSELNHKLGVGLCNGKSGFREGGTECLRSKQKTLAGSDEFERSFNSSEPLIASLFVPRNDKLVKIDGNLIINSVIASEKAMASKGKGPGVKIDKATMSTSNEARETGLAIPDNLVPALVEGRQAHLFGVLDERQKALDSGIRDTYTSNPRSSTAEGSLQKWFHESLEGPIFSSGMCTEVFQFDISPSSSNPGTIIPATYIANSSAEHTADGPHRRKGKNRRVLNHLPVPAKGSALNETEERTRSPSQNESLPGNKTVSSMVVSVLVDPREGGDVDGMIRPKSLSRIFVVVLIDSVKYVTYSCVLPLKGSGPHHLVTT